MKQTILDYTIANNDGLAIEDYQEIFPTFSLQTLKNSLDELCEDGYLYCQQFMGFNVYFAHVSCSIDLSNDLVVDTSKNSSSNNDDDDEIYAMYDGMDIDIFHDLSLMSGFDDLVDNYQTLKSICHNDENSDE